MIYLNGTYEKVQGTLTYIYTQRPGIQQLVEAHELNKKLNLKFAPVNKGGYIAR